jgi:histone-lysine N-methyltransferase SETMAR
VDSVNDAPHARRPKTATSTKMVEKVKDLIATYARFTTRYKAKYVGVYIGAAHTIIRCYLKIRRISARCVPHLITKEQTLARVRISKQLLEQFPQYNNQSSANIITGYDTWVHFYHPKRKIHNTIWATKGSQRPCIAKLTMSVKNVMNIIFFTNQGPDIRIAVPKRKYVNPFYKGKVLHKLKKYSKNCRTATCLHGVRLLHDNASSRKAAIVREKTFLRRGPLL